MILALVDVDGTLFSGRSAESAFILNLARNGLLGPRQIAAMSVFPLRWAHRFGQQTFRKNKAYLSGLRLDTVKVLAQRFVDEELLERLRPEILQRLKQHQANGDTLALLTGTPDFIAAPLAAALGIDHWRATECQHANGRFTVAPPEAHPFGNAKITYALELCAETGLSLSDSIAYADSIHDGPLFEQVGTAIAVAPGEKLSKLARTRGWEVIAQQG